MFRGRLRRRAFWGRVAALYTGFLLTYAGLDWWVYHQSDKKDYAMLALVFLLVVTTALVVVQTVKRLHDTNLIGWWWLLVVPIIGNLFGAGIPLVDGTAGPNRFGPDPKKRLAYSPPANAENLPII
ncbi:DUF805 domain-containing protein [Hymenobacter radiodurans]|uniref:DUF805 domain-containing protein n=1 Tax=Hymenobacter radiodurans TaxID=2496028 RepID=UPI0010589F85|nr:DUF805 domain-containing protein [Hymenobacter radiodurans]